MSIQVETIKSRQSFSPLLMIYRLWNYCQSLTTLLDFGWWQSCKLMAKCWSGKSYRAGIINMQMNLFLTSATLLSLLKPFPEMNKTQNRRSANYQSASRNQLKYGEQTCIVDSLDSLRQEVLKKIILSNTLHTQRFPRLW